MARDISILLLTAVLCGAALWRPWLGVIGMAFVEFLHPQGYGSNAVGQIPAFLVMFIAALAGFVKAVVFDRWRPRLFWDWRLAVFGMLWSWFATTTYVAINPWLAVPKMIDVAKILPPLALALLLIDSREKLRVMVIAIGLSIALIAAKGGFWAVMTGFHDRVYGPFKSPWFGNNEFSVAAAAAIPLLVLWLRETPDRVAKGAIMLLIAAAYAAALSSWSRGGLLSICAVTALIVWNSKHKLLAIPAALALVVLVVTSFPENWLARMGTIVTFEDDPSAQGRLRVWQLGIAFVKQWPWMGAGFEAWIFFRGGGAGPRDWHSAYIEMAAEHGLIGLALWVLLLFGTMVSLTWLAWQGKRRAVPWMVDYGTMLRASLVGYAVGAVFLGIAYWPLPYWLVTAAILAHAFAARETSAHLARDEIRSQSNGGGVQPAIAT